MTLDADLHDVLYNLGTSAAELGRVEQARRALSRFVESAPLGALRRGAETGEEPWWRGCRR